MLSQNTNREKITPIHEAIGQSEAFMEFREQISRVAPIDRPVLILGERGTGKELAASSLHFLSGRWHNPLVTLNCSALTPGLIGSELFGYEKGAFTGAAARKKGRFEKASDGTLFLDEIGTIPLEVQEKILRVVEYGSFERVGSSDPIHVDVRIVAATNADLKSMADSGRFKQDLLDRLSFEVIYVPPLRKRKEDILILANHFAGRMAYELGRDNPPEIVPDAAAALENYPWPGNIRELKNVIERAVYKAPYHETNYKISEISFNPFISPFRDDSEIINKEDGEKSICKACEHQYKINEDTVGISDGDGRIRSKSFKEAVAEFETALLNEALNECRFNQKAAAQKLGLSYHQLRGLLKKHEFRKLENKKIWK
jgi:psp operon transcriptional activator